MPGQLHTVISAQTRSETCLLVPDGVTTSWGGWLSYCSEVHSVSGLHCRTGLLGPGATNSYSSPCWQIGWRAHSRFEVVVGATDSYSHEGSSKAAHWHTRSGAQIRSDDKVGASSSYSSALQAVISEHSAFDVAVGHADWYSFGEQTVTGAH